jgi:hypothetical protein
MSAVSIFHWFDCHDPNARHYLGLVIQCDAWLAQNHPGSTEAPYDVLVSKLRWQLLLHVNG